MTKASVRERLAAGPVRGLGAANAIAGEAARSAETLEQLVEAASDSRAVVSMRAANALKKVQSAKPEALIPHARKLVRCALDCEELRTRWNLTLVVGALPLKGREKKLGIDVMFEAMNSNSAFLRTFAMQGLVNFSDGDDTLRSRARAVVQQALQDDSAAVRARARKLIPSL